MRFSCFSVCRTIGFNNQIFGRGISCSQLVALRVVVEDLRMGAMRKVELLNIGIHNVTMTELLGKLRFGGVVFTANVDHLVKLQKDRDFYLAYQGSDYRVCDSQILLYAAKFLGTPLTEKLSGSDIFPAFYTHYKHDRSVKIFLLGATPGVASQAQKKINLKVGRDMVVASYSPTFGFEKDEDEC